MVPSPIRHRNALTSMLTGNRVLPSKLHLPAHFLLGSGVGAVLMWTLLGLFTQLSQWASLAIPAPALTGSSTVSIVPERIQIPAVNIDASFTVPLGLNSDQTIMVPEQFDQAGWYQHSPVPGAVGPAVVLGHVDSTHGPAVFHPLRHLSVGDQIVITRSDGVVATFVTERISYFTQRSFPTGSVYSDLDYAGLRLITCGGSYNPDTKRYSHNQLVFARLLATTTEQLP